MIAGLADTHLNQSAAGRVNEDMTAGKGFIDLAAMIFGFADSFQVKLQILRVPTPSEFLLMAPYIVTRMIVTGVVGCAIPPAADGQPYEK